MSQAIQAKLSLFELITLAQATLGNIISALAIFVSLAFGYLVVAYIAGAALSRLQVRLLSVLFLLVMTLLTIEICNLTFLRHWYAVAAKAAYTGSNGAVTIFAPLSWAPSLVAIILSMVVFACLYFMWNVRHPGQDSHTE